jgi:ankyrin repeat protein
LTKVRQYLKECKDPSVKNVVDQQKRSPLHICAQEGKAAIVELLLLNNFNPNARDRLLRTPLHYAALHGWDAVADTLLRTGADILAKDSLGRSAIHFAACGSSSVLLTLLLTSRPELVNDLDHKRRCPLHYGVWNSSNS